MKDVIWGFFDEGDEILLACVVAQSFSCPGNGSGVDELGDMFRSD